MSVGRTPVLLKTEISLSKFDFHQCFTLSVNLKRNIVLGEYEAGRKLRKFSPNLGW